VLLTDAERLEHDRYVVGAVWHRDHYLSHHDGSAADPVLLAETARQAAIHLSHRFLDVPQGMPFVLSDLSVDLTDALPPLRGMPLAVGLDVVCRPPEQGARRLRLELRADVLVHHRRTGRVTVRWEPMEPRRYALLRRRAERDPRQATPRPAPRCVPVPAARVGQLAERDVLIAADPLRADCWWLRLDPEHPVLFDHGSDHVPGMALVEGFRQTSQAAAAEDPAGVSLLDVRFTAFGALDVPVAITVEEAGPGTRSLTLTARQGEQELARATVRRGAAESLLPPLDTAC
jgi:hypothetical protein